MNVRTLALSISLLALGAVPAAAQGHGGGGHSHASAEVHGGSVTMTKAHHFEVAFTRDSVRVYLYNAEQKPVSVEGVLGKVIVKFRQKGRKSIKVKFKAKSGYLEASMKLKGVPDGGGKASFEFANLPESGEPTASFIETVKLARVIEFVCPMKCEAPKAEAGRCGKCGMALKPSKFIYACSMHPEVTARKSGAKCWTCGMKLTKSSGDAKKKEEKGGHGKHSH